MSSDLLFPTLKVRFKIATNRETKVERATDVEILPESFEESIEQRRHVRARRSCGATAGKEGQTVTPPHSSSSRAS